MDSMLLEIFLFLWGILAFGVGYSTQRNTEKNGVLVRALVLVALSCWDIVFLAATIVLLGLGSVISWMVAYFLREMDFWQELKRNETHDERSGE